MENKNELYFYPVAVGTTRRKTIAGYIDSNNGTLRIAKSECSQKDQFTKKKGRSIAMGRAMCTHPISQQQQDKGLGVLVIPLDKTVTPVQQFIEIAKTL